MESSEEPSFDEQAKISEAKARDIATSRFPGEIVERKYEIEANGRPTYEFDIIDDQGTEFKVEVDATTGEIGEVSVEDWLASVIALGRVDAVFVRAIGFAGFAGQAERPRYTGPHAGSSSRIRPGGHQNS